MATANLKDRPTPPPLPPPPRFMDEAVNGQASGWFWLGPASQRRSQSPPATDNETVGGAEYEPTFIAQRSASDLERSSHQRPSMHSRTSVSGNDVARLAINTSLNNPVHELRPRPSISLTRPAVMPNPAPAEGLTLLQTDQGFHGEKPLSARSVEQSNNAYDQSLLSKLGGPESARSSISSLAGSAGKTISTLPFHSKSRPSIVGISSTDPSLSPREETSPPPFTFSANPSRNPSIVRSTLFDNISYQSPSAGNVVPTSVEVDPLTQIERRPTLTKHRIIEDITGYSARVPRRSYDVNSYRSINNQDGSFSRHLSLDESRSRRHENTAARLGIKRRASSPPRELDHQVSFGAYPFGTNELSHRNSSNFLSGFTTPSSRYHGSISSLSSYPSYRNPSLASSTGFSAAASSMTSVEGPLSPMSDLESPYENIVSPNTRASISGLSLQSRPIQPEPEIRCGSTARKLSTIPDFQTTKSRPTKVGQVYICECCSKKHKKFDNLQDLR
ncbi:hypothetical protein KEM56_003457 [Ascosphaera pollenicola]|nr:hypothetical protein KEM56_003457 [Ascosphaera pollenicola]